MCCYSEYLIQLRFSETMRAFAEVTGERRVLKYDVLVLCWKKRYSFGYLSLMTVQLTDGIGRSMPAARQLRKYYLILNA